MPGLVRVTVKGKGGPYAFSFADSRCASMILDPPAAETGECGDARYSAPFCAFNASGTILTCR